MSGLCLAATAAPRHPTDPATCTAPRFAFGIRPCTLGASPGSTLSPGSVMNSSAVQMAMTSCRSALTPTALPSAGASPKLVPTHSFGPAKPYSRMARLGSCRVNFALADWRWPLSRKDSPNDRSPQTPTRRSARPPEQRKCSRHIRCRGERPARRTPRKAPHGCRALALGTPRASAHRSVGHHRVRPPPQARVARISLRLLAKVSRASRRKSLGQKLGRLSRCPEKTRRQNRRPFNRSPRAHPSRQQPVSPQQDSLARRPQRLPHRPARPRPPPPLLLALIHFLAAVSHRPLHFGGNRRNIFTTIFFTSSASFLSLFDWCSTVPGPRHTTPSSSRVP